MTYEVGDVAQLQVTWTNVAGVLTDPTTVTLIVRDPSGAEVTYTSSSTIPIVHVSTGIYTCNVPIALSGITTYQWAAAGALVAAQQGSFTTTATILTQPPPPASIDLCSLDDIKAWLDLSTTPTSPDLLLSRLISACSAFVRNQTQRDDWTVQTYNEVRNGNGNTQMSLRHYPARLTDPGWSLTVNSVTIDTLVVPPSPNGVVSGWTNDELSVYLVGGGGYGGYGGGNYYFGSNPGIFWKGKQNIILNYTCGYAATPYDIAQAVIEAVAQKFRRRSHIDQDSVIIQGQNINFSKRDFAPEVWTLIQEYKYVAPISI